MAANGITTQNLRTWCMRYSFFESHTLSGTFADDTIEARLRTAVADHMENADFEGDWNDRASLLREWGWINYGAEIVDGELYHELGIDGDHTQAARLLEEIRSGRWEKAYYKERGL